MAGGIKNWPNSERPRERMMRDETLSEGELLGIIIGIGDATTGRSAVDLGRDLLTHFGGLRGLAEASCTEICQVKGMGPAKSASVKAALALAKSLVARKLENRERFTGAQQVFEYAHLEYRDRKREYCVALLLDGKNRIIKGVEISVGSLNQSIVHPREVFKPAVHESAAAIILIHNHPTGDPSPSQEDHAITQRLREAGDLMGIKVLDHIIIGNNDREKEGAGKKGYYSFSENGAL